MGNLNRVMLIGRLGKDPEIRYTQSGSAVANFTMATNEFWVNSQGERQERTEWHSVVAWDKLADLAQSYLKQGSQVYLEGKLQTSTWDDAQTGQKRYKTEIVVRNIQFLDNRPTEHQNTNPPQSQFAQPAPASHAENVGQSAQYSTSTAPPASSSPQNPSSNAPQKEEPPPAEQSAQHFTKRAPVASSSPPQNPSSNAPQKEEPSPKDSYIEDDIPF